ncbi:hypothetical protein IP90_03117 [Luteimonas cucumeris]|uniref:Lipoprotein n=1 Tax=Luteimonas cucumeris TaxID=985012 RepID=A0A562KVC4_9GAMM|nr:hypothetical protein [Luteimonas cucumeris]TWH99378.1 hypothetical protein IP90_03117 [Luteimonas cucumeris]
MQTSSPILHRVALALLLAPLLLAGCQKAGDALAEAALEKASGNKVDIDPDGKGGVTLKTEKGEVNINSGDDLPLPKGFPGDLFLPEAYRVESVMEMGGAQVLSLRTQGAVPALYVDARAAMAKQGWKETMAMQPQADNALVSFEKERRVAMLSFSAEDDDVVVGVQLGQKPQ